MQRDSESWLESVGNDSPRNKADKLKGPVQNSYRAEVRAALHAVTGAREPTIVIIDCKSVVGIMDKLLQGNALPPNIADRDMGKNSLHAEGAGKPLQGTMGPQPP